MIVNEKTVEYLAHLARLSFKNDEKKEILNDLNRMLEFVNKLNEVNTDNVKPLIYINEHTNIMRNDEPHILITQKDALKNAPDKDSDYFKAPKVIDKNA
jgi:aspartyl-tRNA(Asn)/glutamyl-tRNA(Gln) amidotransferase subunit C